MRIQKALSGMMSILLLAFFVSGPVTSFAQQDAAEAAQAQAKTKKESLTFDDELVEGATQKPELFYLLQKKNFNYKKLIKLRENFLPEMRKTSEAIQRGGNSP